MKQVFPLRFKNNEDRYIKCTILDSCEVLSIVGEDSHYVLVMSSGFSRRLDGLCVPEDVLSSLRSHLVADIRDGLDPSDCLGLVVISALDQDRPLLAKALAVCGYYFYKAVALDSDAYMLKEVLNTFAP